MRAIRSPGRRRVAAILVATLACSTITTFGSASPAHAAITGCQNGGVYAIWARGSGAKIGAIEATQFHDHVQYALNAAGGGSAAWVELGNLDASRGNGEDPDSPQEYPAPDVGWAQINGQYHSSVAIGTDELVNHLNHRYTPGPVGMGCSTETAIIGGYSQGADVVGWALERNGGGGYAYLSSWAKDHIGYVALYGDPKMDVWDCPATSWWVRGNPPCTSHGILNRRVPYVRDEFVNRFGSWCDRGDVACNRYANPITDTHTTAYAGPNAGLGRWIHQSAAEVASKARTKRCQLSGLGCPTWGGVGNAIFTGGNVLYAGSEIGSNRYLASPDGRFALFFQADRNLVLYGRSALWWTGTGGSNATRLAMQTDGNLVLYNGATPIWQSGTLNSGASRLEVQSDGNLVLYTTANVPVWWTGAGGYDVTVPRGGYLLGGNQQLDLGQYLQSPDKRYTLLLQSDGNLVLYGPGYHVLWQSGTSGQSVSRALMQTDGNFVLYRANNTSVWQTGTSNSSANRIVVQNDGNLVVYRPNDTWVWQSGTGGQI